MSVPALREGPYPAPSFFEGAHGIRFLTRFLKSFAPSKFAEYRIEAEPLTGVRRLLPGTMAQKSSKSRPAHPRDSSADSSQGGAASKLISETKQRRPFASAEEEVVLNLLRTNDRAQIHYTRLFRRYGLTSTQYNILRILRGEGGPLPCLEVAARLVAVVPGITGLIDRLARESLVTKTRCTKDRRVIYVDITEKALKILAALDKPLSELHTELFGHLSGRELQELTRLLEKARVGFE